MEVWAKEEGEDEWPDQGDLGGKRRKKGLGTLFPSLQRRRPRPFPLSTRDSTQIIPKDTHSQVYYPLPSPLLLLLLLVLLVLSKRP